MPEEIFKIWNRVRVFRCTIYPFIKYNISDGNSSTLIHEFRRVYDKYCQTEVLKDLVRCKMSLDGIVRRLRLDYPE